MAKLVGNVQFTGTLSDLSAYKRRGSDKIILRRKGGASKHQIKTGDNFVRVRENNSEFGGSATAGKGVRFAFTPLKHLAEPGMTGQVNALCRAITAMDTVGEKGKRSVRFSLYHHLLDGFNLNRELLFNTVVRHPVSFTFSRVDGSVSLNMPALLPGLNFYTPPQYHLYRFIIVLGVVPEFVHGPVRYTTEKPEHNTWQSHETEWRPVKETIAEQQFQLQLKDPGRLKDTDTLILSMGIAFGYPVSNNFIQTIRHAGAGMILATG